MEKQEENDLFFVCSFIEYIARKTKNKKKYVVEKMGLDLITKIYKLAEVYHSENIDKVSSEIILESGINDGSYELKLHGNRPTFWELGRVYQRLILMINNQEETFMTNLIKVMSSWLIEEIDNYDSSLYYETPEYIYECYKANKIL